MNYAVIVGLDRYTNPAWELKSAVKDALRFASWAIQSGGVAPENIKLLLSPLVPLGTEVQVPHTPISLPFLNGTSDILTKVLYDDFKYGGWGKGGERLYFYYSGHGSSHPAARGKWEDPVLIFSDVEKVDRDSAKLFSFSNILGLLRGCGPKEQFFFIDACRDFALDGVVEAGGLGGGRYLRPISLANGAATSKQWMIYATSPGELARETLGKGVFGEALLRGLRADPAAPERVAGKGTYELRFGHLFAFVQAAVKRSIANIPGATRSIQVPEQDPEPSVPDPLLLEFSEEEMADVELLIRFAPELAQQGGKLAVFYEQFIKAGPVGPPVRLANVIKLKPAYYSVTAECPDFESYRSRPFRLPLATALEITLSPTSIPARPNPKPQSLSFSVNDTYTVIAVTGPNGYRDIQQGQASIQNPEPGVYHVRLMTPEGLQKEQSFEYPFDSGPIKLDPPKQQLQPQQMSMLSAAGITPSAEGYLQPSEVLGEMANLKPASLLAFAAYAAYTIMPGYGAKLRSFGLEGIPPARRAEAWVSVLVTSDGEGGESSQFVIDSSIAIYAEQYSLGRFRALPGYPAAGQFLTSVAEGNITVEVRLAGMPPVRLPLTCFGARVATLCLHVTDAGEIDAQIYLMPFDWQQLDQVTVRVLEQAQRFYAGSEPIPDVMIEQLLHLKSFDPLLGCLAGYTLVRQNRESVFYGQPVAKLAPGAWNNASPMQNMLGHFSLLPDAHVLAGLCDPDHREEHFAAAMERGIPLFTEGFRALLDHYRTREGELKASMWHARRTLSTGSAFSAWIGYEPALVVEKGHFATPPVSWSVLNDARARIEAHLRAVGAVRIESATATTYRTGFLVAPDLVLTANHVVDGVVSVENGVATLLPGVLLSFVPGDRADKASEAHQVVGLVAIDKEARIALLRLDSPLAGVEPLSIAPTTARPQLDERVYLIGYPFLDSNLDPALVKHAFGEKLGTKRLQPAYIVAVQEDFRGVDHDALTLGGSAGSPVLELETGLVIGLHWGGMNEANFKRGRATALWKPENRGILRAYHVTPD